MVTVFDNFTISIVSIPEAAGDNVIVDNPEAILLITPDLGYSVLAQDFNFTAPLPNHVASVNFVQVGTNVECIVTFTSPFIMPASDVEIGLCLKGLARLVTYNVAGQINVTKTNAASSPSNLTFNISANFNSVVIAKTITLSANSNFYFPVEPTLVQTVGDASIFTITNTKVFDINGNLLSKTFTINCTIPNYNSLGNIFEATAIAFAINEPLDDIVDSFAPTYLLGQQGDTTTISIIGGVGANWTLTTAAAIFLIPDLVPQPPETPPNLVNTISGVIDSSGVSSVTIIVPAVSTETIYTVDLTGDLASPYTGVDPLIFTQPDEITVTFTTTPNAIYQNNGDIINQGFPYTVPTAGMIGFANDFTWDITHIDGYGIFLAVPNIDPNFSNLDELTNGGTNFGADTIAISQASGSLIQISVQNGIDQYGGIDVTSALDVSEFIAYVDTADPSNVAATTATSGGSVVFTGSGGVMGLRGLCYSTNPLPTVADSTVPGGTGFSAFTSSLTGLSGSTLYYTRAYAYNLAGDIVSYGPEKTFTTLPELTALPTNFVTNEDTNFTIQLLKMSEGPSPDFIITSLPNTLQGDIYDPGTGLKITTVPYTLVSSGSTILFDPALNYFGNITPFNFMVYQNPLNSNVAAVNGTVLAINDSPTFMQSAPLYGGDPGGTYTYVGYVTDPDTPDAQLVVTFVPTPSMPSLPLGWTLVQTPGTNQFTLTGPVPAGADYSIILQVSDGFLVAQQIVTVNAVFATLASMEFKINYRAAATPAGTGRSPKANSLINISASPVSGGHTCNRAQFNLVAGVFVNTNGGEWQWKNLGKASLNNSGAIGETYNLLDGRIVDVAKLTYGSAVNTNWLNIAAGFALDLGNLPVTTFVDGNLLSYYNSGTVSSTDRTNYFRVSNAIASELAIASNWVGSPNRGVVRFKLVANTYDVNGNYNPHSGAFGWMQIFKENSAGTNQEEVLTSGASFVMSGSVVVTVDILSNTVVVTT